MKIRWIFLLSSYLVASESTNFPTKNELENYSFILVMPRSDADYLCAIFSLDHLKVCRFPNGPMWSNSITSQELYIMPKEAYLDLKQSSQKLPVLCIDDGRLQQKLNQNRCNKNVCGFALPWESGMAYVFDDLREVDRVSGMIIGREQLMQLKPQLEILGKDINEISNCENNLSDVDLLIQGNLDDEYVLKPLPYPFQKIKNLFGKIAIACLISYHELRLKIATLLGRFYARSET